MKKGLDYNKIIDDISKMDKKELFDYLDNYIFDSQSELKGEINQWICMKMRTKYYTEWRITDRLYDEYLDYKTK